MDDNQKERLEQELKFLKESFEAEVISKEEFEKGKDRIDRKLREIRKQEKSKEQKADEQKKDGTEEKSPIAGKEGETIKLKVIQDEVEEHPEPVQIKNIESQAVNAPISEPKAGSKIFKYAVVFVVLLLAFFFLYSTFKGNGLNEKASPAKNAETKEPKTNVLVLHDKKNCFNCGTQRVLGILESWFGSLNAREIDYNTDEGRSVASKFDAKLLPLYVLDVNITKKQSFSQFKQVFARKGDAYVLNDNTAGSTFYFKRENIPNKLDFFVRQGDESSMKAEKNLEEFLKAFSNTKFEKHLSTENLAKELDIRAFPTFLVNNRVKFAGVHTAETIKSNFCRLNKLSECNISLSKNLI